MNEIHLQESVFHSHLWGPTDGCYCEKFRNFVTWAATEKKNIFFTLLGYPSTIMCIATGNGFTANQWYQWKAMALGVCLLPVWRVYNQAFGRYRPWMLPKSGHITITKIANLHIDTHRKIHWFQECYSFWSTTKNNEVITEKPFQNSGITRRLWTLSGLELMLVINTSF